MLADLVQPNSHRPGLSDVEAHRPSQTHSAETTGNLCLRVAGIPTAHPLRNLLRGIASTNDQTVGKRRLLIRSRFLTPIMNYATRRPRGQPSRNKAPPVTPISCRLFHPFTGYQDTQGQAASRLRECKPGHGQALGVSCAERKPGPGAWGRPAEPGGARVGHEGHVRTRKCQQPT